MRILVLLLVLTSCAPESPAPPERVEAPPPAGAAPAEVPEAQAGADSNRVVSVLAVPDERTLRLQLRAPADGALYLDNCGGAFAWGLEHEVDGVWQPAWMATINECHSAPIVIAPGEALLLTGTVALDPGETLPAGRYRVALYGLFSRHDQENHMDNPRVPEEMRVSEPMELGPFASN